MPRFQTISPVSGQVMSTHTLPTGEELALVIMRAHNAQQQWAKVPLKQRARLLKKIANAIESAANETLIPAVRTETGKPLAEITLTDIAMATGSFAQAATMGQKALSPKPITGPESWRGVFMGRTHTRVGTPWGVVAVISPWNYPLGTPAWGIASALMAGNAVVLKPSELTPGCGEKLIELIRNVLNENRYPQDLVQSVVGDGSTGELLLEQDINAVVFTGSTPVGRHIQGKMAQRNIPVSLELGGSCPMVVLPTALRTAQQLDSIASLAVWGRCVNAGQSCAAVKRLLVPVSRHESVVSQLVQKMGQLTYDTEDATGHMGPMISMDQRYRLHLQVQRAVAEGGHVAMGGQLPEGPGSYYPPTLITHLPSDASVLQEEWFGPVLIVQAYTSTDDAIRLANHTPYGLTASVFGELSEAQRVASQLNAGLIAINDLALSHYGLLHVMWSGVKHSGPGVAHSLESLESMVQWHTVGENHTAGLMGKPPWVMGQQCEESDAGLGRAMARWMRLPFWRFDALMGVVSQAIGRLGNRL